MFTHLRQRFWTATVSATHYGLSANTIHTVAAPIFYFFFLSTKTFEKRYENGS